MNASTSAATQISSHEEKPVQTTSAEVKATRRRVSRKKTDTALDNLAAINEAVAADTAERESNGGWLVSEYDQAIADNRQHDADKVLAAHKARLEACSNIIVNKALDGIEKADAETNDFYSVITRALMAIHDESVEHHNGAILNDNGLCAYYTECRLLGQKELGSDKPKLGAKGSVSYNKYQRLTRALKAANKALLESGVLTGDADGEHEVYAFQLSKGDVSLTIKTIDSTKEPVAELVKLAKAAVKDTDNLAAMQAVIDAATQALQVAQMHRASMSPRIEEHTDADS